jgi:hypothetical protein
MGTHRNTDTSSEMHGNTMTHPNTFSDNPDAITNTHRQADVVDKLTDCPTYTDKHTQFSSAVVKDEQFWLETSADSRTSLTSGS